MDIVSFREYCLSKKGVTESFPFGEPALVFKVMDKMFALTNVDTFVSVNLKCDPEKAITLREEYPAVTPGYHMSKKHWNTIEMNGTIPDNLFITWIDHSYDLVVAGLSKASRQALQSMGE